MSSESMSNEPAIATFAAGCFWGVETNFRKLIGQGVLNTRVGYTGGHTQNPSYEDVCSAQTGHAEAIEIQYDPTTITYEQLLRYFFKIHNPTQNDRQGPDVGSQYRSAIFYHDTAQKQIAEKIKQELENSDTYDYAITTEIQAASTFFPAEEYHQRYHEKHGGHCNF